MPLNGADKGGRGRCRKTGGGMCYSPSPAGMRGSPSNLVFVRIFESSNELSFEDFLRSNIRIFIRRYFSNFSRCAQELLQAHPTSASLRSKKKTFLRTFQFSNEDCIRSRLPLHCPQVAATQTSAVGVRWKLQLPRRGIETTVTAGSLLNDLLTKPARALTVLGALQRR